MSAEHDGQHNLLLESSGNEMARYRAARDAASEPTAHVFIETESVHVVVERLVQSDAQHSMIDTRWIDKANIIFRECDRWQRFQRNAVALGMLADR